MSDSETTLTIRLQDEAAGGPVTPAPVPPPGERFGPAPIVPIPSAVPGGPARPGEVGRVDDVAGKVNRGLLNLAGTLERFDFTPLPAPPDRAELDRLRGPAFVPVPPPPRFERFDFAPVPSPEVRADLDRLRGPIPVPVAPPKFERFDFAPVPPRGERLGPDPVPAAGGGGGKPPAPPPLPNAPFDFTPPGGVPFDFTPGALSPDSPKKPTGVHDFVDLRPASALPRAMPIRAPEVPPTRTAAAAFDPELAASLKPAPFLALTAAAELTAGGFKMARAGAEELGGMARQVAGNDGMGLIAGAADRTAAGLDLIPVAGKPAAEAFRFAAAGVRELDATARAFVARARELSQYDGRLAAATAMADVRKMSADAREARRIGDEMAKLVEAQSRLDESIQDALAPFKKMFAEWLTEIIKKLTPYIDLLAQGIEGGVPIINELLSLLKKLVEIGLALNPAARIAVKLLEKAAEDAAKDRKIDREKDEQNLMDQFFAATERLGWRPSDPNALLLEQQQADRLGIPLLSR